MKEKVVGIIQVTRRGVGYLKWPSSAEDTEGKPLQKEDIEIQTPLLFGALNGDTIEVEVVGLTPRPTGKVAKIEARAKTEFVCTVKKGVVVADDQRVYRPFTIVGASKSKAEEGSKVLVKLLNFDGTKDPEGEIVEVIGKAGEHRVEMNAIVLEHGFQTSFPADVATEAKEIEKNHATIIAEEAPKRADYRGTTTFTIDPLDAKDFDDALSVKELPNDEYEIGVHIADATFFVREGTALGTEAARRATSVYLVDATIPMLPEELSGNVCSLREGEDRLTFSAVFRINKRAEVLERRFEKSVIRSNKRFTYEQAQAILDTQSGEYLKELNILRDLSRIMRKQKEDAGAIDFGDREVKFTLDEQGKPLAVTRKHRIETNLLIEEFMLLANREVALFVTKLAEKVPESGMVFLYRIHDQPKEDRIGELATFVRAIGYDFANKRKPTAKDIRKLLEDIKGKPEEHLIRTATLRSMAKAIYSTKNIGHFGLSFAYYTHFTSPIRRYPDMLVHRIVASHLDGAPITRREYGNLEQLCLASSAREAEATDAERESIKYKLVEFMTGKIGQTFDAVVSGVTEWGLYVDTGYSTSPLTTNSKNS